jgi:hypothetical protein
MIYKVGQNLKIECFCQNCLPVRSKWNYADKKPSHKIREIENEEKDRFKTVLTIEKATEDDEKMYECELINDKSIQKWTINAVAHYKPKDVEIKLMDEGSINAEEAGTISKNETYTLDCSAMSNPIANVSWYRDGVKLEETQIVLDKKNLASHAGRYKCIAENYLGSESKVIDIRAEIPANFYGENDDVSLSVKNDEIIDLNCEINGIPRPVITWTFNNQSLPTSNDVKLLNQNEVLQIVGKEKLAGEYACAGQNEFGEASKRFTVEVEG